MTDGPSDSAAPSAVSDPASTPAANDFQPDVPPDLQVGTVANGESSDPDLETTAFGARDPIEFDAPSSPGSDTGCAVRTNSTWSPAPASPAVATGCWSSMAGRRTCSSGRHWTPR